MAATERHRQGYTLAYMSFKKEFLPWKVGQGKGSDDEESSLESQGESPTPSQSCAPGHMGELLAMICKSWMEEKNQNCIKVKNAGSILESHLGSKPGLSPQAHTSTKVLLGKQPLF